MRRLYITRSFSICRYKSKSKDLPCSSAYLIVGRAATMRCTIRCDPVREKHRIGMTYGRVGDRASSLVLGDVKVDTGEHPVQSTIHQIIASHFKQIVAAHRLSLRSTSVMESLEERDMVDWYERWAKDGRRPRFYSKARAANRGGLDSRPI